MNKIKSVLFVAGISLALAFTFGCSGDGSPPAQQQEESSSSEGKIPNHCVYQEEKLCLHGANPCPGGGTPSEECPFQSSNSVSSSSAKLGSSSAGEDQAKSSSSKSEQSSSAAQEQGYCLFEAEKICLEIENTCPSIATFSKTCPYSSSKNEQSSSSSKIVSSSSIGLSSSAVLKNCDAIFNPDNKFCYDGVVYDKCKYEEYSPEIYICDRDMCIGGQSNCGYLFPAKCDNESYNPLTQGCCSRTIFSKTTQRCTNNRVENKCEDIWYDQATRFCYDGIVYNKCGNSSYNPLTQFCYDGRKIVETKCGNGWYDQETEFCLDNKIYAKCDGIVYPPATHICQNGVATPAKCDNESYNLLTQFCKNGTVKNYDIIIDARDGKKYKTVVIGNQTWMAENLNYEASSGSECNSKKPANCDKYGRLYNWATAQVVCPSSWHLPSYDEWNALITTVGGAKTAGTKLKATSGWLYNGNGTDDFGFSALPGGYSDSGSNGSYFIDVGSSGYWWTATAGNAYADEVYMNSSVSVREIDKKYLMSVRCVKD